MKLASLASRILPHGPAKEKGRTGTQAGEAVCRLIIWPSLVKQVPKSSPDACIGSSRSLAQQVAVNG